MLFYEDLKTKPKTLMAMMRLKQEEFKEWLSRFAIEWKKTKGQESTKRGRPPTLANDADRLFT